MAATIHVILQQDLANLGKSGELVKVRPGYARNFLIPRQLAVPATASNVARIEHERRIAEARAAKLKAEAVASAEKLAAVTVSLAHKAGEDDKLFGSVTSKEIAAGLAALGHSIDKKKIALDEPIRTLGTFDVAIKLAHDVVATIKVEVKKK